MTLPKDTILTRRYRLGDLLARGGLGAIYTAFDINLRIPVAIKENFLQTPQRVMQFKHEAQILARLRHPALPRVIDHFSFEERQYLVMDYIEGEDLWEIVKRRGEPLPEAEALDYILQICEAVDYLHRQEPPIIHRDIKPQNIKITPAGRAVLVDFGIAKEGIGDEHPPHTGARGATPEFSPPEQYSAKGTNPTSDIYAMGATLYAVLTGKNPPNSVSRLAGKADFEPPDLIHKGLSRQTVQAIIYAMQPVSTQRPQSISDWRRELMAIAHPAQPAASRFLSQSDETLANREALNPAQKSTAASTAPNLRDAAPPEFWLIDAQSNSRPLGAEPLWIGRHSEADVMVDDMNVSRYHAQIKVEGNRCFVLDENSASGTFLNGHRIGSGWYPLSQGDLLTIGPARFYLSTNLPASTASSRIETNHKAPPVTPAQDDGLPTAPVDSGPNETNFKRPLIVVGATVLIALLAGLSIGGYLWLRADPPAATNAGIAGSPTASVAPTRTITPDAVITATSETVPVNDSQPTASPETSNTSSASSAAAEATRPTAATKTATPRPTQTESPRPTSTDTPTATASPLPLATAPSSPLATPTPQPLLGPTVIPLNSQESVSQLGNREVIGVVNNPKNPIEVYALVKGDGIYKSIRGGEGPWAKIDLDGSAITGLVIDPTNPARLYAPTWNAVLRSSDGGNTWEAKTNGLVSNQVVETVTIHPNDPNILYAGVGETLVISEDQGDTWTSRGYGAGLGVTRLYDIAVDPFQTDTLYVAGLAGSIYKSIDSGQIFNQLPYNVGQAAYSLAADPVQSNVYLAGINSSAAGIIKTENGTDFRSVSTGLIFGGADSAYSAITFAPSNLQVVYAGSGYESNRDAKGIFKSTDGGENWNPINRGLAINPDTNYPYYVKTIVVHPTNSSIVFAATGSGLYKSISGGESWELK